MADPSLRLITDHAIGEGKRSDGLDFEVYSKVLSNAACGTPGPFTIGVFGEWGTGKTSLMRMVQRDLESRENVLTVWFNAWQYEGEPDPVMPLVGSLVKAIDESRFLSAFANVRDSLLRALRAVAYGLSAKTELNIPWLAKVQAGVASKDMIERAEALDPAAMLEASPYHRAFQALSASALPEGYKLVVLIDDLDRCFPDKAIRLLESIKLVLAQQGFIFVIGVARRVLEGYLTHRYKHEFGLSGFNGSAYLDKIIQLAFPIPPHNKRMGQLAHQLTMSLNLPEGSSVARVAPLLAKHLGANPRSLVRFVNNLLIDAEIARLLNSAEGPVAGLDYFAVSRCLQLRWPSFFQQVVFDNKLATWIALTAEIEETDREADDNLTTSQKNVLRSLDASADLRDFIREGPCQDWLRNHGLREQAVLCTERDAGGAIPGGGFPERYLTLVTGPRQELVAEFVAAISTQSQSEEAQVLDYMAAPTEADSLIDMCKSLAHSSTEVLILYLGDPLGAAQLRLRVEGAERAGVLETAPRLLSLSTPEGVEAESLERDFLRLFGAFFGPVSGVF